MKRSTAAHCPLRKPSKHFLSAHRSHRELGLGFRGWVTIPGEKRTVWKLLYRLRLWLPATLRLYQASIHLEVDFSQPEGTRAISTLQPEFLLACEKSEIMAAPPEKTIDDLSGSWIMVQPPVPSSSSVSLRHIYLSSPPLSTTSYLCSSICNAFAVLELTRAQLAEQEAFW